MQPCAPIALIEDCGAHLLPSILPWLTNLNERLYKGILKGLPVDHAAQSVQVRTLLARWRRPV